MNSRFFINKKLQKFVLAFAFEQLAVRMTHPSTPKKIVIVEFFLNLYKIIIAPRICLF